MWRGGLLKAQAGYYQLPSAAAVFEERVAALREAIPSRSVLLDLGCNDGSIARELLASGTASRVHGYDLENIVPGEIAGFSFGVADLVSFDLSQLPDANGVLILNVLHHVVGADPTRAREIVDYLLDRYPFVCVDLGSITEVGDWGWRKTYDLHWTDDKGIWDTLFASAGWRFKLLRYPAQGGHRVLWKLYKRPYPVQAATTVRTFQRQMGSWMDDKRLVQLGDPTGEVAETVQFSIERSAQGDLFWRKSYLSKADSLYAELEAELGAAAVHVHRQLADQGVEERFLLRPVSLVAATASNSNWFIFEPELLEAKPVHYQDWSYLPSPGQARAAFILSCAILEFRKPPAYAIAFLS